MNETNMGFLLHNPCKYIRHHVCVYSYLYMWYKAHYTYVYSFDELFVDLRGDFLFNDNIKLESLLAKLVQIVSKELNRIETIFNGKAAEDVLNPGDIGAVYTGAIRNFRWMSMVGMGSVCGEYGRFRNFNSPLPRLGTPFYFTIYVN